MGEVRVPERKYSARRQFVKDNCIQRHDVYTETVSSEDDPDEVPRTWIMTMRDRAVSVKAQRRNIEALGGVSTLIEMGNMSQPHDQRAGTAGGDTR